jgi:hypothetical protein
MKASLDRHAAHTVPQRIEQPLQGLEAGLVGSRRPAHVYRATDPQHVAAFQSRSRPVETPHRTVRPQRAGDRFRLGGS